MKKTGFTLAEVLITLTIIGVVAMMTLPALMNNVQEQQAKTGLKKGLNTLTEAAQLTAATDGFDYASLKKGETEEADCMAGAQSLPGLLKARTQYDASKTYDKELNNAEFAKIVDGSGNYVIFFRDGSAVSYKMNMWLEPRVSLLEPDGLPKGFSVVYDINGEKKPNLLSNCMGKIGATAADRLDDRNGKCHVKKERVIRDQFGVRLRGRFAQPNGAAARWALEN
jgi:prepilin-type N-terminal cleavage/methylation domain-containing protein